MSTRRKLWIGLAVLIALSPLGLIVPAALGAGTAWGEWNAEELSKLIGHAPSGMLKFSELWNAPFPDYALRGQENASLHVSSFSYILSGLLGAAVVVALTILIGKILARREEQDAS